MIVFTSVAIMNTTDVNRYNNCVFLFSYSNTGCYPDLHPLATEEYHVLISVFIFRQGLYNAGVLYMEVVVTFMRHILHH